MLRFAQQVIFQGETLESDLIVFSGPTVNTFFAGPCISRQGKRLVSCLGHTCPCLPSRPARTQPTAFKAAVKSSPFTSMAPAMLARAWSASPSKNLICARYVRSGIFTRT